MTYKDKLIKLLITDLNDIIEEGENIEERHIFQYSYLMWPNLSRDEEWNITNVQGGKWVCKINNRTSFHLQDDEVYKNLFKLFTRKD